MISITEFWCLPLSSAVPRHLRRGSLLPGGDHRSPDVKHTFQLLETVKGYIFTNLGQGGGGCKIGKFFST